MHEPNEAPRRVLAAAVFLTLVGLLVFAGFVR